MDTSNHQVCDASGLPHDQQYWNAGIFFLFPVIIIVAFGFLIYMAGLRWLYAITPFDMVVMGLATFRLIRMIVFDKVFSFARNIVFDHQDGVYTKPEGGFRRAVAELIECLWCTGVWAGLAAVMLYYLNPLGRFFVIVLAVAALGSFFQVVSKAVGKHA